MAKFITNSTGTRAVRKEDVKLLVIDQSITGSTEQGESTYGDYELKVVLWDASPQITFESNESMGVVQALAASVLAELEE